MREVSRFEANLLEILRSFLGEVPRVRALTLMTRPLTRPKCLGRDAVQLVQEVLAKGVVRQLARGGWRKERFLRDGKPVAGRLWRRSPPDELALEFSRNTLDFLIWATAQNVADKNAVWRPLPEVPLTLGDRYLLFRAYATLRFTPIHQHWQTSPVFAGHGLCGLSFPEDLHEQSIDHWDFGDWTGPEGAFILESMQRELAARWLDLERSKGQIVVAQQMRALGRGQRRVLDAFLVATEKANRRDLARFLLTVALELLPDSGYGTGWVASLDVRELRMVERTETQRAAFTLLDALRRLEQWQQRAQGIGYLDEEYASAQLYKADWEDHSGNALCNQARTILARWNPLQQADCSSAEENV